ncbi:GAF domain-containing sensor histidine kinase [Nocardioides sp.]|uniref:GAF domain-containing sensor histidine kinase n=1 Tax=Nocardioides sp. TaxID=35761 RepID=UPI00286E9613|nr:GAF domain-containing sensor histidine kinase [Nocardioides sp.]
MGDQHSSGSVGAPSAQALQRLSELVRRVNSSTDTTQVLEEIANGVREVLGYGVAAISQLEGDTLVMVVVAGPEDARRQILGRRTPAVDVLDEYRAADHWGILRYVPHGRLDPAHLIGVWTPDIQRSEDPDDWHPDDALYAPLYSATGELLGNMAVDLPPGLRVPGQAERDLLEMFVVQAGLALSNAQQRERLARQVHLGGILKEVAQAGSQLGIEALLDAATDVVNRGFGAVRTWVRCLSDGEGGQETSIGHPPPAEASPGIETLRTDLAVTAWPTGALVLIAVDDVDSAFLPVSRVAVQAAMRAAAVDHGVIAPVGVGPEMFGYLAIGLGADHPQLRPDELATIGEIARELGRMVHSARLFETEQRLVSELRDLDRYKGELIATISHELKTPLTTIIGHVELMEDEGIDSRSVEAIGRNAERLDRLIQNLLDYAQVQERRDSVRRTVDLVELVDAAIELLSQQAESGGVRVVFERPPCRVEVLGDAEEIGTVLNNLLGNAVKYTRTGGRVDIEVAANDAWTQVAVSDTGIGISPVDHSRVFSTFHRSSNPEALSLPGTGLGLAISRRIAEAHGGRIEVESTLGAGSTFRLLIPSLSNPTNG